MSASLSSDSPPIERDPVLTHRAAEGAIFLADGRRVAAWSEVFLQTLHRSLAQETPDTAAHVLYRVGFEWGLQDLLQLHQQVRDEFGRRPDQDLWKLDDTTVFQRWSTPLATAGWGRWEFDRTARASGLTIVELHHSAVAAALASPPPPAGGESGAPARHKPVEPVCHLYAGVFAGALSFYDRAELHAVETECVSLGHACCRFLVGPGPIIDRAETARRTGANHDAIVRAACAPTAPAAPPTASAKPGKIPWKK